MAHKTVDRPVLRPTSLGTRLRRAADAVVDLALPGECASCAAAGPACCRSCSTRVWQAVRAHSREPLAPAGGPPVWAACAYDDVAASLLVAYKDGGRRDLVDVLAPPLALSMTAASRWARWPGGRGPVVVGVPSARAALRRRGDHPLDALTRAAVARLEGAATRVVPALEVRRRVADQSTLGRDDRAANVAGAFVVRGSTAASIVGRGVILVDDVVTTGATLAEAERALRAAGALEVRAAVVAATPRRHGSARRGPLGCDVH